MTRVSRALKSAALPGALGVVAALGQAPLGLWWATLVALAFLGKLVAGQEWWRGRLWTGWTAGVGYFAASLFWIVEPFMVDAARDGWMAPFAVVFMAAGMALFWALAASLAGLGRSFSGRTVGFALGLAASDLVRSYIFTGFPWALVGHVWVDTPVAQAAALGGPIGLSLLTAMMAALPVVFQQPRWAGLAISCVVLAVLWSGGAMRLAETDPAREPAVRVRLVQPNATQSLKWDPQMRDEFMRRQMEATSAPQAAPLDLVIWPETAVPWLLEDSADVLRRIRHPAPDRRKSGDVILQTGHAACRGTGFHHLVIGRAPLRRRQPALERRCLAANLCQNRQISLARSMVGHMISRTVRTHDTRPLPC